MEPKKLDFSSLDQYGEIDSDPFIKELSQSPEVLARIRELGLTKGEVKDNIGLLLTYLEDRKPCLNCPGLERCQKANTGIAYEIVKDGNSLLLTSMPCPHYQKKIDFENCFLFNDMPEAFLEAKLQDLGLKEDRSRRFLYSIKAMNKEKPVLYTYGEKDSGVSFHLSAYCNNLARKGETVAYIDAPSRFKEMADAFFKSTEKYEDMMFELYKAEHLFIDGFAMEARTSIVRDKIYTPLLEARIEEGKFTYIGSKAEPSRLAGLYSAKDPKGGRDFASLILDHAVYVDMDD